MTWFRCGWSWWVCFLMAGLINPVRGDPSLEFDHHHTGWSRVLAEVVNEDGDVDYAALKQAHQKLLHAYLRDLARVDDKLYRSWTREEQLAYLINLYNAQTLDLVIRHYPLNSIREIGSLWRGPWGQPVVSLFGKITTLDQLEHKLIRPLFHDERTHFALVCAARSAPPLRQEPYQADRLNEQLRDQAERFLRDPTLNRLDVESGLFELSPVFKWFAEDFERAAGTVEAYVKSLLADEECARLHGKTIRIRYRNYDWSLNDQAKR